jgi:tripartite-type tricarboxylate transporter receptor subunit TctC
MAEAGVPGVELLTWFAAMVPAATPRPIVDKLNKWFNEVLATEETKKFLNSFGGDPFITTPEDAQALFRQGVKDWERFVRMAKIEPQ